MVEVKRDIKLCNVLDESARQILLYFTFYLLDKSKLDYSSLGFLFVSCKLLTLRAASTLCSFENTVFDVFWPLNPTTRLKNASENLGL